MIETFNSFLESKEENCQYFVYCFLDTRKPGKYEYGDVIFNYEPIYIGKGKGNRAKRHFILYKKYNTRFYSKMMSIIKDDFEPEISYLMKNLSEKDAFSLEKYYIELIGRKEYGGTLTNLTDGGDGQSGIFSDESKRKMSKSHLGEKNAMFNKKHTDAAKLKISLSKKGKESTFKNKKHSVESKEKMSSKAKLRTGEKNSMFNKKHSDESKEKMSTNRIKKFGEENPNFGREYKESEKTFDTWKLTDKDDNVVIIDNLSKYCRENDYNPSCIKKLYTY